MDNRPNKRALIEGLDVYRDAMRPFMVRCLKRVHGGNVEDHISKALRDEQRSQFEQNLSESQSIEEAIDINHFPQLVKAYWHEAFRDAFRSGSYTRDTLFTIGEARNKASHPGLQDVGLEYTVDRLDDISGVLIDINEPELSQSVETIRAELMPFRMFAHRFHQGGRDVYAFPLNLATLDKLLPDRVDDRVVKDANRPLTPSHAKKIQQYLEEREDWLLGTLLLGVSPEVVDFRPYTDSGANTSVGELTITIDGADSMKMFDGQHRRRAIRDVLYELSHGTRYSEKLSFLREASLPIMLYVEDDIEALRQMFADAAKTRSIERNTVTRFDQTDAFNLAALWIARESDLFAGRVEMERASVARSSPHIIAVNQLAMTLKTLEVGYKGRASKNRERRIHA